MAWDFFRGRKATAKADAEDSVQQRHRRAIQLARAGHPQLALAELRAARRRPDAAAMSALADALAAALAQVTHERWSATAQALAFTVCGQARSCPMPPQLSDVVREAALGLACSRRTLRMRDVERMCDRAYRPLLTEQAIQWARHANAGCAHRLGRADWERLVAPRVPRSPNSALASDGRRRARRFARAVEAVAAA